MLTDILIPLSNGSKYNNIELKYCLRSIEKHLSGVRNVFIVGELPGFVNPYEVTHIPLQDSANIWEISNNIYRKIMAGIKYENHLSFTHEGSGTKNFNLKLSENFLFFNDDHFLLTDYEAANFPYYHRGPINLDMMRISPPQLKQYQNSIDTFGAEYDFGIHCPILYNKYKFRTLFANKVFWPEHGYEIKSVYGNDMVDNTNWMPIEDLKFTEPVVMKESIYMALEGRPWFSIGDSVLRNGTMQEVLKELYPNKSKYEL